MTLPLASDPLGLLSPRRDSLPHLAPSPFATALAKAEASPGQLNRDDLLTLLQASGPELRALLGRAYARRVATNGNKVYFRGIVELSNLCVKNCSYCGIRRDNHAVERFTMTREEILSATRWAFEQNYGSVVLQSGERTDDRFVSFIEDTLLAIKEQSQGRLGITLSLGEQSEATYRRWFAAGAHRYLLRIETSNPGLYAALHPADHRFEDRVRCLRDLRRLGYQVGTGVMIGLPGQSLEMLADDVLFFRDLDVDMLGMGPYVVHENTPLGQAAENEQADRDGRLRLGLKMIAVCRLALPGINIASTTALQALHPLGREYGLRAGANVVMPIITPLTYRKHYQLYDGKPCLEDTATECQHCLEQRIESAGDVVGYGEWGDSPHAQQRTS